MLSFHLHRWAFSGSPERFLVSPPMVYTKHRLGYCQEHVRLSVRPSVRLPRCALWVNGSAVTGTVPKPKPRFFCEKPKPTETAVSTSEIVTVFDRPLTALSSFTKEQI